MTAEGRAFPSKPAGWIARGAASGRRDSLVELRCRPGGTRDRRRRPGVSARPGGDRRTAGRLSARCRKRPYPAASRRLGLKAPRWPSTLTAGARWCSNSDCRNLPDHPDIRVVVDAGLARRARFDPGSGMSRLMTERVTRAEADQRRAVPAGSHRAVLPALEPGRRRRAHVPSAAGDRQC